MLRRIMSTDDVKLWRKSSKSSIASSKSELKRDGVSRGGGGHIWVSTGIGDFHMLYIYPISMFTTQKDFSWLCQCQQFSAWLILLLWPVKDQWSLLFNTLNYKIKTNHNMEMLIKQGIFVHINWNAVWMFMYW